MVICAYSLDSRGQCYTVYMRASSTLLVTTLVVLICAVAAPVRASAPILFTENLSLGSRGAQVIVLQKILNRDIATRIASTGPGSPGNETGYFGSLTKEAVIRFQEKYSAEILAPAKLSQGNGYVGSYTRNKLNALSTSKTNTENANAGTTPLTSVPATTIPAENFTVMDSEKLIFTRETKCLQMPKETPCRHQFYYHLSRSYIQDRTNHGAYRCPERCD